MLELTWGLTFTGTTSSIYSTSGVLLNMVSPKRPIRKVARDMFEPMSRNTSGERGGAVREMDDRLYGKLLETNTSLNDAGGVLIFVYALLLLSTYLCFGSVGTNR